ncbi:MAG: phage holin family protein, partial [Burkholderiaceae bacterium]
MKIGSAGAVTAGAGVGSLADVGAGVATGADGATGAGGGANQAAGVADAVGAATATGACTGGAGVFGLFAFGALTAAIIALLATAMDTWIAALIVAVVYGAVAGILALR